MIADVEFVQETFYKFNKLCFSCKLPPVRIVMSRAKTFFGRCEYKKKKNVFGKYTNYDYVIKISTAFDISREELEDVVIHEMIHYYIAFSNIRDNSTHGDYFKRMMNEINSRYGRHLSVSSRVDDDGNVVSTDNVKAYYLCVTSLSSGIKGITVCAKTKVFEIFRLIPQYYKVDKMEWYLSLDPYFERFPRSNTPKIYRISPQELENHLNDAMKMVCTDRELKFV